MYATGCLEPSLSCARAAWAAFERGFAPDESQRLRQDVDTIIIIIIIIIIMFIIVML